MTVLVCRMTFGLVLEGLNDGKKKIQIYMRHHLQDVKLKLRV